MTAASLTLAFSPSCPCPSRRHHSCLSHSTFLPVINKPATSTVVRRRPRSSSQISSNLDNPPTAPASEHTSQAPACRRSKLILTRRIFSWTLRRRITRSANRPPIVDDHPEPPSAPVSTAQPVETLLGQRIAPLQYPIETLLSSNEPVPTFVFQRGAPCFGRHRRPGDPPNRYLRLSYSFVDPFSANSINCSNPRVTGTLKGWYQVARRWDILDRDYRQPLILKPSRRVTLSAGRLQRASNLTEKKTEDKDNLSPSPFSTKSSENSDLSPLLHYSRWDRALGRSPRIIVVGDVHGCIDELKKLLRLADYQPGDQVVLLGDVVAKGPDSVSVVQLAREIGARSVRGNHDFEVVRWWDARRRGDVDTMVSVEHARIARDLGEADLAWLVESPWFIECAEMGHLFVHAGFIPGVKLTQQNPRLMMNMRSVLSDGTVTAKNVPEREWAKLWRGPQTVVFGHDAFRGLQLHEYAKGIDTGCVYGGRLTALLLPENRLISVDSKKAYISPKRFRVSALSTMTTALPKVPPPPPPSTSRG